MDFWKDICKTFFSTIHDAANNFVAWLITAVATAVILFFKRSMKMAIVRTKRRVLYHEWKLSSKANALIFEDLRELGGIYGWVFWYHNHGPKKMTMLSEVVGGACLICTKNADCLFNTKKKHWFNNFQERPIDLFWLEELTLETLRLNGKVNEVKYDDMNELHKEMFNDSGINQIREIFIKTNNDGFIALSYCFCERFIASKNVNAHMVNMANKLAHYF